MKPSIPRGTRDFGPAEMQKRNYIFSILRKNFELFGYEAIETPAMEKAETLLGKYGEEGDKLIYKIRSNKNLREKLTEDQTKKLDEIYNFWLPQKSDKALRYDLTVPFARFVVQYQNKLTFPFKRYQIQPVWRGDNPQAGRYREFWQCDADVIGSNSLVNELDLIALIDKSFSELKVPVVLKINNRKILAGVAESIGTPDRMVDIAIAIDKVDKIGQDGVEKELKEKGFTLDQINKLIKLILLNAEGGVTVLSNPDKKPTNLQKLNILQNSDYSTSEIFQKGCEELRYLIEKTSYSHLQLELDFSLARGLNYYTGTIFEVKANAGTFTPSILGGGRYDDLTGIFGLPNMSGVGISFGVDRIYDVMEELNLFPDTISKISSTKLLFAHFDESNRDFCIPLANELRKNNISCEIYPDVTKKVAKQFDYANKKNIPYVCVIGSNEMQNKRYMLKDMSNGTQEEMSLEDIIKKLK
jgi:histidyl-tRNA synthetase